MFTKILKLLTLASFFAIVVFGFFQSTNSIPVLAQNNATPAECKMPQIDLANLFILSKNVPIVPEGCASGANGPNALSPAVLGDILIRAYAFIASLAFNLITPALVGAGIYWTWSGLTEKDATGAKRLINNLAIALGLIIFAYLVPFTIRSLLFQGGNTDLSSFFSFNTVSINK